MYACMCVCMYCGGTAQIETLMLRSCTARPKTLALSWPRCRACRALRFGFRASSHLLAYIAPHDWRAYRVEGFGLTGFRV